MTGWLQIRNNVEGRNCNLCKELSLHSSWGTEENENPQSQWMVSMSRSETRTSQIWKRMLTITLWCTFVWMWVIVFHFHGEIQITNVSKQTAKGNMW